MSYICCGKRYNGTKCKKSVPYADDYCSWHQNQKTIQNPCECYLPTGNKCPYSATENGFCQYHQTPEYCQGKTILGETCLKAIDNGRYCFNCKNQESAILDSVKEKAEEMRGYLMREGKVAVVTKKPVPIAFTEKLKIPDNLKKTFLAKPETCAICMEELRDHRKTGDPKDEFRSLKCGHYFHMGCLSNITKFVCPMCRAEISKNAVPKWVALRIESNLEKNIIEEDNERTEATIQLIQTLQQERILGNIIENDMLEINSSEEEDLRQNLASGLPSQIIQTIDEQGQPRRAIVFISNSP